MADRLTRLDGPSLPVCLPHMIRIYPASGLLIKAIEEALGDLPPFSAWTDKDKKALENLVPLHTYLLKLKWLNPYRHPSKARGSSKFCAHLLPTGSHIVPF